MIRFIWTPRNISLSVRVPVLRIAICFALGYFANAGIAFAQAQQYELQAQWHNGIYGSLSEKYSQFITEDDLALHNDALGMVFEGNKNYNTPYLPTRIGIIAGLNVNFHNLSVDASSRYFSRYLQLFSDNTKKSGNIALATALGLCLDVSLPENFGVTGRLNWAMHSEVFRGEAITPAPLYSIGLELLGVYKFARPWRAYAGLSFVGLSDNPFIGALCLPMIGVGYDINIVDPASGMVEWTLTPEVMALAGITNMVLGLPPSPDYWFLSQIRIGFSFTYHIAPER